MMQDYILDGKRVLAVQVTHENAQAVAELVEGRLIHEHDAVDPEKIVHGINFMAFGRVFRASEDDWVVKYESDAIQKMGPVEFSAKSIPFQADVPEETEPEKAAFDDPFAGRARFGTVAGEVSSNEE
jgi:hypothetical protein